MRKSVWLRLPCTLISDYLTLIVIRENARASQIHGIKKVPPHIQMYSQVQTQSRSTGTKPLPRRMSCMIVEWKYTANGDPSSLLVWLLAFQADPTSLV